MILKSPTKYGDDYMNPVKHDFNGNNILDIVHRTAELQALIEMRMPDIAPKLCRKLQIIRRQGQSALARFANDIDLITALR